MSTTAEPPGEIEIDDADGPVRVRLSFQKWFTLPELRNFAAWLIVVADENEPSADVQALVQVLEAASILPLQGPRALARAILAAGYSLQGNQSGEG